MKKYIVVMSMFAVGLLTSIGYACSIYVKVYNDTDHYFDSHNHVVVLGPYGRNHARTMQPGGSFTYHAVGSAFTCHGTYKIRSNIIATRSISQKKDGTIIAHIVNNKATSDGGDHPQPYTTIWSHG